MNCSDFQELMFDYADGSLPADARTAADSHLAGCPACRGGLGQEEKIAQVLSGHLRNAAGRVSLSPEVRQRILAAVDKEASPGHTVALWSRIVWPLGIAAGLVLLAAVVLKERPVPANSTVSVQVSYVVPVPEFRRDGEMIIDTVSYKTVAASGTFQASLGKPVGGKYQER